MEVLSTGFMLLGFLAALWAFCYLSYLIALRFLWTLCLGVAIMIRIGLPGSKGYKEIAEDLYTRFPFTR